jgi:hypothetical protein
MVPFVAEDLKHLGLGEFRPTLPLAEVLRSINNAVGRVLGVGCPPQMARVYARWIVAYARRMCGNHRRVSRQSGNADEHNSIGGV